MPQSAAVPAPEQPLKWSTWSRYESSFGLLLVPSLPGVYVLAEEVVAAGEMPTPGEKRVLAVLEVGAAADLARTLSRLSATASPLRDRLAKARCFTRYAVIPDPAQRQSVCGAIEAWLAGGSGSLAHTGSELPGAGKSGDSRTAKPVAAPLPLPAGF